MKKEKGRVYLQQIYKDTVFWEKENLFRFYNAMNGTAYEDTGDYTERYRRM